MKLIDRYIHEVGRYLPRKNRQDIQAELRSLLVDTIEDRITGEPTEEDIIAVLKEFGAPKEVAASYYPERQYLIGPTLYPVFRLVVVIAIASVIGAQLLSFGITTFFKEETVNALGLFASIMSSIPSVLGFVVIAFIILQWLDVRTEIHEKVWNPLDLPEITDFESVKQWEQILGIVGGVFILGFLTFYPSRIGILIYPGGNYFDNPVINRYLGLIILALILGIVLDIYLLWQSRWQNITRIAKIGIDLFSIAILALLVQGHTAWLAERNASRFFFSNLGELTKGIAGSQVIGMQMFRMIFGIALIASIIDVILMGVRLIRANMMSDAQPVSIPIKRMDKSKISKNG